jgi:hypothetical protein
VDHGAALEAPRLAAQPRLTLDPPAVDSLDALTVDSLVALANGALGANLLGKAGATLDSARTGLLGKAGATLDPFGPSPLGQNGSALGANLLAGLGPVAIDPLALRAHLAGHARPLRAKGPAFLCWASLRALCADALAPLGSGMDPFAQALLLGLLLAGPALGAVRGLRRRGDRKRRDGGDKERLGHKDFPCCYVFRHCQKLRDHNMNTCVSGASASPVRRALGSLRRLPSRAFSWITPG